MCSRTATVQLKLCRNLASYIIESRFVLKKEGRSSQVTNTFMFQLLCDANKEAFPGRVVVGTICCCCGHNFVVVVGTIFQEVATRLPICRSSWLAAYIEQVPICVSDPPLGNSSLRPSSHPLSPASCCWCLQKPRLSVKPTLVLDKTKS